MRNNTMCLPQNNRKKRTVTCLYAIGALILAGAFVFIGCEEASPPAGPTPPPSNVPNAPTNLTATAGNGEVVLNWTAPSGGVAVAQYYIYRAEGADISSATRVMGTDPAMIKTTAYTDTDAANGIEYTYAVRAVSANNTESGNSNTATATPRAPEDAPSTLRATPADGSVSLTWTPPTGGMTVSSYRIYRATGSDALSRIATTPEILPADTRTYIDESAENGTTYRYTVRAVNDSDEEGSDSEIATVTPLATPNPPTNLVAADGEGSVTLTWTAPASGAEVAQYYIYRKEGTDISGATRPSNTVSTTITDTTYTDRGLVNGTTYIYAVRAVNANGAESANSNTDTATPRLVPGNVMAIDDGARVMLSWTAPTGADEYYILRTVGGGTEERLTTPATLTATTYIDRDVAFGATYQYRIQALSGGTEGEISSPSQRVTLSVDRDHDTLIDIYTLNMLDSIRHNLSGTSYKSSAAAAGLQCGMDGATACTGYELMRDLDFAVADDYASSSIEMAWRPTMSGSVVAPDSASNNGWSPIPDFATLFEGNGRSISNLYSRHTVANFTRIGLFGWINTGGTLRNLLIEDSNVYGGNNSDEVGIAVGRNSGTISNVAVQGGSAHGGGNGDNVGGLAGWSNSTIVASSSTADAYGNGGIYDQVGGLVGEVEGGTVTASYATGVADGGTGDNASVGGLVGNNQGTIRASYARGNANAGAGNIGAAGGLVGIQSGSARIIASYATGNADGGASGSDAVGRLFGSVAGTGIASYAFGTLSGGESPGNNGSTLPNGAHTIGQLTMPVAANPPNTAAPADWNRATDHTMDAWDFGTETQFPVLRYADYDGDGSSSTDYCASFGNIPGTSTAIVCGTTPLSGQEDLRAVPAFDLTVSATVSANPARANASVTLTAIVRNSNILASSSPATTLTYYRSTDDAISTTADNTSVGTDTIPVIHGGGSDTQEVTITTPATDGTYYYYACVSTQRGEGNANNNCSSVIILRVIPSIDSDGDTLIDIRNLDMLDNIRHNLAGTSYKLNAGDSGQQCGTDGTAACTGYELMQDLDFAVAGSYESGTVNMAWRPTAGGSIVAPDDATNSGWPPIGDRTTLFATLFEGNGYTISNLYSRDTTGLSSGQAGLFGNMNASGTIRNLLIEEGNVYGGSGSNDTVGIAVGGNAGIIVNVVVRGGSAHGGARIGDFVGGLVGQSSGTIIASSSTAAVYGDTGIASNVGGLVGTLHAGGTITASYATGAVTGGTGGQSRAGGLVGFNQGGTIRASYVLGSVTASAGINEEAGGLVGDQSASAMVIASYATGNVDGGAGGTDTVGMVVGSTAGTVTASYGFGTVTGGEATGNNGATLPAGASTIAAMTIPVAMNPPNTAAPAAWNQMSSSTLNAWDFGTTSQNPALRYADYDGAGGTDYCAMFTNVPGTTTAIVCGTTLLPDQR